MLNIENFLIHTIIKEGVKSMLVMKLVHNNDLDFVKELQELRELLKKKNITMNTMSCITLAKKAYIQQAIVFILQ